MGFSDEVLLRVVQDRAASPPQEHNHNVNGREDAVLYLAVGHAVTRAIR
jgi:hypothetical protein